MKWIRDAFESRSVWPYYVRENVIKLDANSQLKSNDEVLATKMMQNWQLGAGNILVDNRARWDVFTLEQEWTEVSLELSLGIENIDALMKGLLPQDSKWEILFGVKCKCPLTRWRIATMLPLGVGIANMILKLKRQEVAGEIELTPVVVLGNSKGNAFKHGAMRKASIVATGFPIYLYVDQPSGGFGSGLNIRWDSFPDSYDGALYYLDLSDADNLVLYMNNNHPPLQSIIDNISRTKNDRTRLRDALFGFIASDVWMQLARFATNMESEDKDEIPDTVNRIMKNLIRMTKLSRDEIITSLEEPSTASALTRAIQHYLEVAVREKSLVSEVQEKSTGEF